PRARVVDLAVLELADVQVESDRRLCVAGKTLYLRDVSPGANEVGDRRVSQVVKAEARQPVTVQACALSAFLESASGRVSLAYRGSNLCREHVILGLCVPLPKGFGATPAEHRLQFGRDVDLTLSGLRLERHALWALTACRARELFADADHTGIEVNVTPDEA